MIMIRETDLDRIEVLLTVIASTPALQGKGRTEVQELLAAIADARRGYPKALSANASVTATITK